MADEISLLQSSPHHSVVRVAGELDLGSAPALRTLLTSADADPMHEFVVALSDVTYMDCSGLAPLLEAHATLGGRLRLRDLPRAVSELLHLTGLGAVFLVDEAAPPVRAVTTAVDALGEPSALGGRTVQNAGPGAAIDNRIVIDQAVGLLMASLGCDARQATHALSQLSWDQDAPVQDVALALVAAAQATGANPTELAGATLERAVPDGSTLASPWS